MIFQRSKGMGHGTQDEMSNMNHPWSNQFLIYLLALKQYGTNSILK